MTAVVWHCIPNAAMVVAMDGPAHVARGSTTIDGKPVVLLQRGKATVMRVGDEPWAPPAGRYGDTVWNLDDLPVWDGLFTDREAATPDWHISGQQVFDGQDAIVVSADGPATIRLVKNSRTNS